MKLDKYFVLMVISAVLLMTNQCYYPQSESDSDFFNDTIVVWDNTHSEMHKLIFHTVYLEDNSISGFSLNTMQIETFHISNEETAKFEKMKNIKGINSTEIKCTQCHPGVEVQTEIKPSRKIFRRK